MSTFTASTTPLTTNPHVLGWLAESVALLQPSRVHWCNGSEDEYQALLSEGVATGVFIKLNETKLPGCYLHRSNPNDVSRVEHLTFICTPTKQGAGPTNNWMAPEDAYAKVGALFNGAMKDRTLYVVPYVMGPLASKFSKIGIQLTDSLYVAINMRIMTRGMGRQALQLLGDSNEFNRGLHSVRDCNPDARYICHFPQDNTIWSVGSGYGGNALLGKKCLALRIGSFLGNKEDWFAEHMLILEAQNPDGQTSFVCAAFPSQCGKTNFAMMQPPPRYRQWKVFTVGDDISWLRPGPDGRLYAVNPEAGYFGVAPGTNFQSNSTAMLTIQKDTIYTNVAMTPDGDVWWEGKTAEAPEELIDWQGRPWKRGSPDKAAHPNSRFTAPSNNNPELSRYADDPNGVPISAIIFGGRRPTTVPLVMQSFDWTHGVFLGATLGSETTAAATGAVGIVRRDPMAMLPFIGYNVEAYFAHWLRMRGLVTAPPKIFFVNWFRKDKDGKFLWPGFGENMRVLQWILLRALGRVGGQETLMGWVPREGDLDLSGLNISGEQVDAASRVDLAEWERELESIGTFFQTLGADLPKPLELQRQLLLEKIRATRPSA